MCETKSTGVMPGFLIGRAQEAAQPCQCPRRAPRRTATQRAQTVLAGVGVVVAMAAANFLEHALLWVLLAVFCGLVVTGVALRYRRRARVLIPAPLPSAPRTTVEAVQVRAIGERPARPRGLGHPGGPPHPQGLTRPSGGQRGSPAPRPRRAAPPPPAPAQLRRGSPRMASAGASPC